MAVIGSLLLGAGIGYAAVALYKILFTEKERKMLESKFKTHHFEYGAFATLLGLLIKSPKTVGTGLYWMLDDLDDADEAIRNLKRKWKNFCDKINQLQTQLSSRPIVTLQPSYNPGYNINWPNTYPNSTYDLSNEIEKAKIWLRNKAQEILQNIRNNSR